MKNTAFIVLIVFLVAVAGFFFGTRFQRGFAAFNGWYGRPAIDQMMWAPRAGMMRGKAEGFNRSTVQGQITKIENNTVTVQLPNGGTYTVTLSDQTAIDTITKGTKEDLKTGQNITVFGGSYINGVQTILINP